MAMTVLRQLMDRHAIAASKIGRLEVGTESEIDASKSIKSHLMMVLQEDDPSATDVEGCDSLHACYGGTAAVQNALNWVESRSWDGRYAVVIMTDIAVYARGPARPTSGAGAVALLIGPDAPLVFERGLQASYMTNAYDFYKPSGLYPTVDGPMSVYSYLEALDRVYARYIEKFEQRTGLTFSMSDADHALFHAPYNKLVQRAYSRMIYLDLSRAANAARTENKSRNNSTTPMDADIEGKQEDTEDKEQHKKPSSTGKYKRKENGKEDGLRISVAVPLGDGPHPFPPAQMPAELDKALISQAFQSYDQKVRPSTCIARLCGNMYTASVWSGVAQLIETTGADLADRRILLYSYGSGIAASMMSLVGRKIEGQFSLERLQGMSDVAMRLARRAIRTPVEFEEALNLLEARFTQGSYKPELPAVEDLDVGTYYLDEVDAKYRRRYCRKIT
jgi:hydroxymethylglutaryl-CoA synthase